LLEARVAKRKGPLVVMQGTAVNAETEAIVAEAEASFMVSEWGKVPHAH
jgi:hypothetical protein